jgi:tetratricopeptide (TPR) repeat protein
MKDAQKKYLETAARQVDGAKAASMGYSTVNRLASELLASGVLLDQAEEYARTGLSMMDEQKYVDSRRQTAQRLADAPAKPSGAAAPEFIPSFSMRDGVMTVRPTRRPIAPIATTPAKPRQPAPPPTEDDLRRQFRSEKASAQATLGQILMKRGKTDEAERLLKEAYAARPASYTMATIARVLSKSAKKAGNDESQLDYMAALALTGRITAAEHQEFELVYRKTHGGTLDGVEDMLDERYRRDNPKFGVTPFARTPVPRGRAVLVEMFTGAG